MGGVAGGGGLGGDVFRADGEPRADDAFEWADEVAVTGRATQAAGPAGGTIAPDEAGAVIGQAKGFGDGGGGGGV